MIYQNEKRNVVCLLLKVRSSNIFHTLGPLILCFDNLVECEMQFLVWFGPSVKLLTIDRTLVSSELILYET